MLDNPRIYQQGLAPGIAIGKRFPNARVVNQADGRAWNIQDLLHSNGRWRLFVFAGDLQDARIMHRYENLGRALQANASPLSIFTSGPRKYDRLVDVITVHSSPRHSIELQQLPEIFHLRSEEQGSDYEKVFADDETYHDHHGQVYMKFAICPHRGCALLLRPDQHVCMVADVENAAKLTASYLENWLINR